MKATYRCRRPAVRGVLLCILLAVAVPSGQAGALVPETPAAPPGAAAPATGRATTSPGSAAPALETAPSGSFTAIAPVRLLDTRSRNGAAGPIAPGGTVVVQVSGRGGVPSGAVSSIAMNVTVVSPTAGGYITAYANGSAQPTASNINFTAGRTVPGLAIIPLGPDGRIRLFNGSRGTVQLLGDVSGFYRAGTPAAAGMFKSLAPARLLDTRSRNGAIGPVPARGAITVRVTGRGGVPATNVAAVAINLTTVSPATAGYITAYADGAARPGTSNVNFDRGQTVANFAFVPVGADGRIRLYNGSGGGVQLLGDVAGYVVAGTPADPGAQRTLASVRLLDTRSRIGAAGPVASGATVRVQVGGRGGVPSADVSAVVINVTVTAPTGTGYITAWPDYDRPNASTLNFGRGQTVANLAIVPVATDGTIELFNGSNGSVALIGDVAGYFVGQPFASIRGYAYFVDSAQYGHPDGQRVIGVTPIFRLYGQYFTVDTDSTGGYAVDLRDATYYLDCRVPGTAGIFECGPQGGDGTPVGVAVPPQGNVRNFIVCPVENFPACLRQ